MRHQKKINHLGRTSTHRKAMLSNMASSLILHKRIETTLAKAKALRIYIEPLITRAKEDSTHNRRMVFSYLQHKEAVSELFREISKKIANRPGGYTRILKTGFREGDHAEMCIIELVDYNDLMLAPKEGQKAKPSRRRRGTGKKKDEKPVVVNETPKARSKKEEADANPENPETETPVVSRELTDQPSDMIGNTEETAPEDTENEESSEKTN